MRHILNWFEFIAVGVALGDLDLNIVTMTVRSNLTFYTDKCLIYISELRRHHRTHPVRTAATDGSLRDLASYLPRKASTPS